jgi:glutamate synthase domain-containing protein 3
VAKSILKNWEKHQADFIKVMPRDYKAVLERKGKRLMEEGGCFEVAWILGFY